mmetsp:Transcript_54159/g.118486  ORF Transcript_54159/g.118486 Transcript_54159/m.118486 type:complete len:123 (-) Transcript_54159:24-392(-)
MCGASQTTMITRKMRVKTDEDEDTQNQNDQKTHTLATPNKCMTGGARRKQKTPRLKSLMRSRFDTKRNDTQLLYTSNKDRRPRPPARTGWSGKRARGKKKQADFPSDLGCRPAAFTTSSIHP